MKYQATKTIVLTASLLGAATIASAHSQSGSLGSNLKAVDYYQIQCFNDGTGDADHLAVQVKDTATPIAQPVISAQVTKGILAVNTTDPIDGDTLYSPEVKVNGGNGSYYVMVDKTKAAADNYTLEYHCETSTGEHTGTNLGILQNK